MHYLIIIIVPTYKRALVTLIVLRDHANRIRDNVSHIIHYVNRLHVFNYACHTSTPLYALHKSNKLGLQLIVVQAMNGKIAVCREERRC
jgi:hypothetical protein